jgi:SAM-dependent methyltransferase
MQDHDFVIRGEMLDDAGSDETRASDYRDAHRPILPDMGSEESVARYYNSTIFEAELVRLTRDSPAERAITLRGLGRLIPDGAAVAEIGVGGGIYSEWLARRSGRLHLVDVSSRLLEAAVERLRAAGLEGSIRGISHEPATHLESLGSGAFGAVLLLGPLYHLCEADERRQAVAEAARILKTGGLLFAAGINRLAYFRELLRESPSLVLERRAFHEQFLRDGNLDPEHAPPIGFAHLTTCAEFRALFAQNFEEVALIGVESFSALYQTRLNDLPAEETEAWIDLIERTGQTPEGVSLSDHFLYAGHRIQR